MLLGYSSSRHVKIRSQILLRHDDAVRDILRLMTGTITNAEFQFIADIVT